MRQDILRSDFNYDNLCPKYVGARRAVAGERLLWRTGRFDRAWPYPA